MEIAIAQAGISPRDVGHLNAHATSPRSATSARSKQSRASSEAIRSDLA